ncbi:MAG: hypothetical protein ABIO16_00900 [Nocardioides sp.]
MRASRRATVTASGLAVLGLTGCTGAGSGPAGAGPTASPSATTAADADPDRVALDRAVALTAGLLDTLTATSKPLDPSGRFAAMHTEHLAVLNAAVDPVESGVPRGFPAIAGPPAFRRREAAAQRELAHLAQEVSSGALARLLAAMSAGIAAHLAAAGPLR